MASALGMGAAWKMKKKSIIFLFSPLCLPCCHGAMVTGKVGLGRGLGMEASSRGLRARKRVCCFPLGRQGCPGLAVDLGEALSLSRACDQSLPDAWRVSPWHATKEELG